LTGVTTFRGVVNILVNIRGRPQTGVLGKLGRQGVQVRVGR
jgi:hypothetical protein